MKFRYIIPVLFLAVFALAIWFGVRSLGGAPAAEVTPAATASPAPGPTAPPSPDPEPTPTPDPAAEALAALTVEQKVGQLLVAGISGLEPGEDGAQAVRDYQVGGVILFGRNVESAGQLTELTNGLKALNGDHIPLFLSVDQEGGRVDRMPPEVTELPAAYQFGQISDPDLRMDACFELGQTLAEQCAAFGFNLDFAPVMDIWSNPDNTVIGDRAFGTDLESVTYAANETACGILSGGVIAAAKHFPGHGDTAVDSHYGLPVVDKSLEELLDFELVPFRQAIENTCVYGAYAGDSAIPVIMVSHILMTAIDPNRPASLSEPVVTGLLREELGFDGVVCTDDLTMAAVSDSYGMGEAAVLAVEAGCDLLLVCHGADNLAAARDALLAAVESGRISMERLDESVYRILALKEAYGLTNAPVSDPDVDALNARIGALAARLG